MDLDFIRASSYTGTSTTTSGEVSITSLRKVEVEGRHVLLVRAHIRSVWSRVLQRCHTCYFSLLATLLITVFNMVQVEDIIDTGTTASKIRDTLLEQGATDVKLVALLDKKERRTCEIHPDYCCFLVSTSLDAVAISPCALRSSGLVCSVQMNLLSATGWTIMNNTARSLTLAF